MHKTYTDCYQMEGFVGGEWAYAVNANDTIGELIQNEIMKVDEKERRLAFYFLGWESVEVRLIPTELFGT